MAQIALAYEGRMNLINEVLCSIYGKPDKDAGKKADLDMDDRTTLVSAKNGFGTVAIMRSLAAKAASVFAKQPAEEQASSVFTDATSPASAD